MSQELEVVPEDMRKAVGKRKMELQRPECEFELCPRGNEKPLGDFKRLKS